MGAAGTADVQDAQAHVPGRHAVFDGVVESIETGWVDVDLELTVDGEVVTEGLARVAVPGWHRENPWQRSGKDWRP